MGPMERPRCHLLAPSMSRLAPCSTAPPPRPRSPGSEMTLHLELPTLRCWEQGACILGNSFSLGTFQSTLPKTHF